MGRILTKEEFMESMASAAEDQELEEREKEMPAEKEKTEIEQEPETKNVVKPRKKRTKKSAPVAAEQKTEQEKQEEALTAAIKLTSHFAEWCLKEARERIDIAERYTEYTEILEGMK